MIGAAIRKRVGAKRHELAHNWRTLVDKELGPLPLETADRKEEERARREKAASLEQLARCGSRS